MLAEAVAEALRLAVTEKPSGGVFHMSARGETTWHGFARAIFAKMHIDAQLTAISSEQYLAPARRPRNSLLDNSALEKHFGIRLPSWDAGMKKVLEQIG